LGPATILKHEAQQKLADYIEELTGKLIHQGEAIESFAELWKALSAVKAGSWGKKMREDLKYQFVPGSAPTWRVEGPPIST